MQISENFHLNEFKCRCGKCSMPKTVIARIVQLVILVLQPLRDLLGAPIKIVSGYRCRKHNKSIGGVSKSRHIWGDAADITMKHKSPYQVWKACQKFLTKYIPPGPGGLGLYRGFIHVDMRPRTDKIGARWTG